MPKTPFLWSLGISLLVLFCIHEQAVAQRRGMPGLQQQIKQGFNRAKTQVSGIFGRQQQSAGTPTDPSRPVSENQTYPQRPYRSAAQLNTGHRRPLPQQQMPPPVVTRTRNPTRHAGYSQQPLPDQITSIAEPSPQQVNSSTNYSHQRRPYQAADLYSSEVPGNRPVQTGQVRPEGWVNQPGTSYQDYIQSPTAMQPKPQTVDYYNEHQYGHFSNRISATERAILLEDELVKIREDKNTLEAKISSLEAQLKQRDYEIEQLQAAVNDAIEQLSSASGRHRQLKQQIRNISTQRDNEKAASEKLLDELRKQLNDLLANELVGSG